MLHTVYALVDPRSPHVYRYVGKTSSWLSTRIAGHRSPQDTNDQPVADWARKLRGDGLRVEAVVLDQMQPSEAAFRESMWIAALREAGHPLLNVSAASGGFPTGYFKHTPESLAKIKSGYRPDGNHFRWHVRRGIVKTGCPYC